ncbi:MAG: hypothetical protein AB1630_04670 [bacterium]
MGGWFESNRTQGKIKIFLFFIFLASLVFCEEKVIEIEDITSEYGEILSITTKDNKVYLECEGGSVLIKDNESKNLHPSLELENKTYIKEDNCPTIQEVQEMAIRYANVSPSLIKNWMKKAKYKALFPEFSINYSKNVTSYASTGFITGPNNWGLSFTWDFGKLLYTDDMEGIDTRSRLMTGLRNEIIQDVTRLYFERKGLFADSEKNKLKIEELSALLDGYTGGYFTKSLDKK